MVKASVINEVKIEDLISDSPEGREQLFAFLERFCAERDLHFTIMMNANDYKNNDGSINEDYMQDEFGGEIMEVCGELASRICQAYADPFGGDCQDYWEPLFYDIWRLELQEYKNSVLAVYDETGETWPKPSAELLEEHEKELAEEREKAEKAEVEAMMDRLPPWF